MLATGSNYRHRQVTGQSNFTAEAAAQGMHAERQLLFAEPVPAPGKVAERLGLGEGSTVIQRRHLFLIEDPHGPLPPVDAWCAAWKRWRSGGRVGRAGGGSDGRCGVWGYAAQGINRTLSGLFRCHWRMPPAPSSPLDPANAQLDGSARGLDLCRAG